MNSTAAIFAAVMTIYYWWENTKGMHESSGKALRIMQITTVMVVIFLIWCPLTLIIRGPAQIPPAPLPQNLHFSDDALGWFKGTFWPSVPFIAIMMCLLGTLLLVTMSMAAINIGAGAGEGWVPAPDSGAKTPC